MISVVAEFAIAAIHPSYNSFLEQWGSAVADAGIAFGIVGEVLFSRKDARIQTELRSRSNKKLADAEIAAATATERAASADLARVKLEAQLAPRALTKEQYDELQTLRGRVSAVNITAACDFEAARFADQVAKALELAGIRVKVCDPRIGLTWADIYIVFPKPVEDCGNEPLFTAFRKARLSIGCGDRSQPAVAMADLPPDIPVVMVGQKRGLLHPAPPYVWTLPAKAEEPP